MTARELRPLIKKADEEVGEVVELPGYRWKFEAAPVLPGVAQPYPIRGVESQDRDVVERHRKREVLFVLLVQRGWTTGRARAWCDSLASNLHLPLLGLVKKAIGSEVSP